MRLPDFEAAAAEWRAHGGRAQQLLEGAWRFRPGGAAGMRLLLTAGVHGDETAPIEMLAQRLPAWARDAASLGADLFIAIGNLDAVKAGKRYLRYDMNRMFAPGDDTMPWGAESQRARELQRCLAHLLGEPADGPVVHLDLHTTIRPSLKPTFAIVPASHAQTLLLAWLAQSGLHAAVLNPGPNVTLSAFTARLGAAACTVELGQAGAFGRNDMGLLAGFGAALDALVRWRGPGWPEPLPGPYAMEVLRVTREIVRGSEHFELRVPGTAPNFSPLRAGQVVACDADRIVRADHGEMVLFPNPSVAPGLRAALLVAPTQAH